MKKIVMLAAIAGTASAALAQNTGAWLTDGGTAFGFGGTNAATANAAALPTSSTGANPTMNFNVPGSTARNFFTGDWYYRVDGDTRERNPNSATGRTLFGTNTVVYDHGNLVAGGTTNTPISGTAYRVQYSVMSTGAASGALNTFFTVFNNTQSEMTINLFFAVDIDLAGSFGGDAYAALNTSGGNRAWTVSDGAWGALFRGIGASGAGVGGFSAINGQMTDANVDNFIPDLNAGGVAAADNAAVMQWRIVIPAGGSYTAEAHVDVGNGVVPTPGAAALLGLGGLAAARRRRA